MCVAAIATALPFRDGAFQSVLCSEVLQHLEDDDRAVAEIARVLKPDGAGVITVPVPGSVSPAFSRSLACRLFMIFQVRSATFARYNEAQLQRS